MVIQVKFDVEIAGHQTDETIDEWLRYELRANGKIQTANPLVDEQVMPVYGSLKWKHA